MHLDRRTPESMRLALECFEEAVELDPDYAVAWVGIADTLGLMHAYGYAEIDVLERAAQAIRTALETDDYCAEAHAANGRMLGQLKREREAKQSLRRAVELMPGYAEAHNWLTVGYQISGDIEAAYDSSRRAAALNPLSAEALGNLASTLLYRGEPEAALEQARKVLELEPGYDTAAFFTALAQYQAGRYDETLKTLDGLELPWVGAGLDTTRALALAAAGNADRARAFLPRIREAGYAFDEGLALAGLGEPEAAFEAFGRARFDTPQFEFAIVYWPIVCVRYLFQPAWAAVRGDPRYAELLQRIETGRGLV